MRRTYCTAVEASINKGSHVRRVNSQGWFLSVLDDTDNDGVIIATPVHWHAAIAMLGAQALRHAEPSVQTAE